MHPVLKLIQQAKDEQWPFPQTLSRLRDAGVLYYRVTWEDDYKTVFQLTDDTRIEENNPEFNTEIASHYSEQAAKIALNEHQQGKTTYPKWLNEMAKAGVCAYRVDANKRTVTYFGIDSENYFVEEVPGE
ncbi:DUF1398 family protein [Legionella sp. 16cNR16C]|uniref:DUF1398 family protein n=1 Tax=Legionella sp. 16cNR16C TaxID=2905656 RepID=UPI001E654FEB|nr:DUF1398 family protein [Legionella sp. 16cNR16C]MCE3044948.1 DUF1398 family protein [Legionella sp. 16cNR16C]